MLHFDTKKFDSHPSTNDIPFKKAEVTYPGAPVDMMQHGININSVLYST